MLKRRMGIRVRRYFPPESDVKGLRMASDLYAPARAHYMDGAYTDTNWSELLRQVGNQRKRLWFLGDRLLDRLEARLLRDQDQLPPGLNRLVNEYRGLFLLRPVNYLSTIRAHDAILDVQMRLVPRDPRPKQRRRSTNRVAKPPVDMVS